MKGVLPFVVVGVATGSVYGLAAMGLVLTYKTSGVFNFAHGAIGTVAAYAFFELRTNAGLPWPLAVALAVAGIGVLSGLGLERLARRLAGVDTALKVVATVGVLVAVQGLAVVRYGPEARYMAPFLPASTFRLFGVNVSWQQLILFLAVAAAAVALTVFFRMTRLGIAMRGVVDDPSLLALSATSPVRVRAFAWAIGSGFAAASGILLAPTIGLDSILLTLLVVQAFGAAAIGGFSSIPMSYAGGIAVGVLAEVSKKYVTDVNWLAGLPSSVPFLVLFVVLLVLPKHRLVDIGYAKRRVASAPRVELPPAAKVALAGVGAVALLAIPQLVGARLPVWTNGMIFALVFLSLNLLVRTSGQVSVAHAGFAAVGASTFALLSHGAHVPWLLALLLAALVAVPVGAFVAIPAIRLSGVYLAVATFGFGILLEQLVYRTSWMFGAAGSRTASRPAIFGLDLTGDKAFFYVVLAVVACGVGIVVAIDHSRLGRLLKALSGSPLALEVYGANVALTRVLVFCISAFMAGAAGALFASFSQSINGNGFTALNSLLWLAVLTLAGRGRILSGFVAGILLAVMPSYFNGHWFTDWQPVLFGVSAIAIASMAGREARVRRKVARRGRAVHSPIRARRAHVVAGADA